MSKKAFQQRKKNKGPVPRGKGPEFRWYDFLFASGRLLNFAMHVYDAFFNDNHQYA